MRPESKGGASQGGSAFFWHSGGGAIYAFLVVTTESHPEARSGGIVTELLKTLRPEIALV